MARKAKKKGSTYDIDLLKSYASGRWPEILSSILGLSIELLSGTTQEHPCPICGGETRFRMIDVQAGALFCSHCFHTGNGDGFAAIQHYKGVTFVESLVLVADHLGVDPIHESNGKAKGQSKSKSSKHAEPDEKLEFVEWNESLAALWCLSKPPINPSSFKHVHAKMARYRDQYTVIAIPVWGPKLLEDDPNGWCLYNVTGSELPHFVKDKTRPDGKPNWKVERKKVLTTFGSKAGLIGPLERIQSATTIWKLEGPSDLLAFYSLANIPDNVMAVTNNNGAGEQPAQWMVDLFCEKSAYVLHDADEPGQNGSLGTLTDRGEWRSGWCGAIWKSAKEVMSVSLPYDITPTRGKDLRDLLNDRKSENSQSTQ